MSRSRDGTWLTTRSPIRTAPPEISSSPPTIRSAVVLPQPDGPTRTTNSPSPMSRSSESTALVPSAYTFVTSSRTTSATRLPQDSSCETQTLSQPRVPCHELSSALASTRPGAGEPGEAGRAGPIDQGLDAAEDRSFGGSRDQDLSPSPGLVCRLGSLVLVARGAPHPLEDGTCEETAEDAEDQAERLVEDFRHGSTVPETARATPASSCGGRPPRRRVARRIRRGARGTAPAGTTRGRERPSPPRCPPRAARGR